MKNVLTFDLEEYFQVSGFEDVVSIDSWEGRESRIGAQTGRLLDLLDEHDVRATFFVLGWTAERHPERIREIRRRGHEIASHGYSHGLVYDHGPRAFRRDIRRGRRVLETILGVAPRGYRAPSFSFTGKTPWALSVLSQEGFWYDSSVVPIRHDRYGIPGARPDPYEVDDGDGRRIHELPPLTRKVLGRRVAAGGGGWLRLFPYSFVAGAIRRANRDGHPAVIYLHPWEMDPDQPRIPGIGRFARWRHFVGMKRLEQKLRRLLTEFEFTTAADWLDLPAQVPARPADTDSVEARRA